MPEDGCRLHFGLPDEIIREREDSAGEFKGLRGAALWEIRRSGEEQLKFKEQIFEGLKFGSIA